MLIPELPSFLTSLGGAEHKGFIISLFTLTAMLSRPFSGKLADSIGRVPVIVVGSVVCMICSLLYPVLTTVSGFFLLRFAHGFSTGFTPTGQSTYVSDVIPADRRGEAMGILGTLGSLGMASGPALGGFVTRMFGINAMFYLSSLLAVAAAAIVLGLKETLKEKQRFQLSLLKITRFDLFEPRVWLPCVIMALAMYAYGAVITLIPDFGEHVGIHRKELLFTYFMISSLLIRLVAGKASDRFGRVPVLIASTALVAVAMLLMSFATNQLMLVTAVFLYGFAQGGVLPTLLAWATDLSESHHKGRALASLYIFMELGIGIGALVSGWLLGHANSAASAFQQSFIACSALAGVAFVTLVTRPLLSRS